MSRVELSPITIMPVKPKPNIAGLAQRKDHKTELWKYKQTNEWIHKTTILSNLENVPKKIVARRRRLYRYKRVGIQIIKEEHTLFSLSEKCCSFNIFIRVEHQNLDHIIIVISQRLCANFLRSRLIWVSIRLMMMMIMLMIRK
jgi:hypothetical protein